MTGPEHDPRAADPEKALRALERMLLRSAVDGSLRLPAYPAVALRAQGLMRSERYGLRDVARLISADATLAASILRCAASPVFARGEPVRNLTEAVTRLGAQEVTRITIASALGAHAQASGALAPVRRACWVESLASAVVAQRLARVRGLPGDGEAFLAGLLHDFGKIVATARLEALLGQSPLPPQPLETWAALVERVHLVLGEAFARAWDLPPRLAQVVALHHGETTAGCEAPALLETIRAADQITALLAAHPHVEAAALEALPGLASRREAEAIAAVIEQLPPMVAALEGEPAGAPARGWVLNPASALGAGERAVDLEVRVVAGRRSHDYTATVLAPRGLVLFGTDPLPEQYLVQATLAAPPEPFTIWAVPRLCSPRRAVFRIELQAFALSGPARTRWDALYRSVPR